MIKSIENNSPIIVTNSSLKGFGPTQYSRFGIWTTGYNSFVNLIDSEISGVFYQSTNNNDDQNWESAIRISGDNAKIFVKNSEISEAMGVYATGANSDIILNSSTFTDNQNAIRLHNYDRGSVDDSIRIENTSIDRTLYDVVIHDGRGARVKVHKSFIKNSYGIAINAQRYDPQITLSRSLIKNCYHPLYLYTSEIQNGARFGGSLSVDHSTLTGSISYSKLGSGDEGLTGISFTNSIIANDHQTEFVYVGNGFVIDNSAIELGENAILANHNTYNGFALIDVITSGILPTGPNGELNSSCSTVDAGLPNQYDGFMPPGVGGVRADLGMYGGPGNTIWGGTEIPDGEPEISQVVDLPNDQGGSVGIQYTGSIFDYGHTGYDIESYSFWRDLDVQNMSQPNSVSTEPDRDYLLLGRNQYWEQIGTMDAQGFENYGFSAPTISDSSSSGIFWSKFLVVAHTPDDDVYFVSDPDSGYSVDNIAPTAPSTFVATFEDGLMTATWEDDVNPDILRYEVRKNGSEFLELTEKEFTDQFSLGDSAIFTIRGVDVNDNIGEFSDPFVANYGTKGDMTWDGVINILDVTKIIYHILFPDEAVTDEEFWAGNYNDDTAIDVVDVTPVVDIILGGLLSSMESSGGQTVAYLNDNTLRLTSDRPITGLQLILNQNLPVSNLTNLNMSSHDGRVVLYTTTGEVLQGENIPLLALRSDAVIEDIILVDNHGERISTVLKVIEGDMVPDEFKIHQNYPNPFNPATLVKVDVNKPMNVMVSVYDVMGREISVLVNEQLHPGYHQFIWDGTDNRGMKAGSGLYFIMVQTPEITRTMKATLLR